MLTLGLSEDVSLTVARLRSLSRRERVAEYQFVRGYRERFLEPTVTHAAWIVDALQTIQALIERADLHEHNELLWQEAGRHYEAALWGAQVLSLWLSWLEFGKALHLETAIDAIKIMHQVSRGWRMMEPVLEQLKHAEPARLRHAAQMLQEGLPRWGEALAAWGKLAERQARTAAWVAEKTMLIQVAIDLYTMRGLLGALGGRGRAMAFMLPGIGGISAGGAATGIRVVISAEWVRAMQHLIAIGAITSVELAKLAGATSVAMSTPKGSVPPGSASPSTASEKIAKGVLTIRNRHLAGKKHPKTGIPYDKDGFPDFSSVTKVEVKIKQTGSRQSDYRAANRAAGFSETPMGYTWHHHQDGTTMQLIPRDIHRGSGHTGGFSLGK